MKKVTAAVLRKGQSILLTRRSKGEKHAGGWEFPGGKVEDGETPPECLERELVEELSLKCSIGRKLIESEYHYEHGEFLIMAFESEIVSGNISLSVHDRAEWVPVTMLTDYDLLPADIPIAEYIMRGGEG